MKILANDGISKAGVDALEKAGFEVLLTKVAQEQLVNYLNNNDIPILLVRSATTVRKELIDAVPGLKLIGRGGVGMDNIDVDYAKSKGISVINTPAASSHSVAELVFAHLFSGARHLNQSNREMPLEGETNFGSLKKRFKGRELSGKTLGIIGFGRIGEEVAKIAFGIGMNVMVADIFREGDIPITLTFVDGQQVTLKTHVSTNEEVLKNADFITVHTPALKDYLIGEKEIDMMKNDAGLVNASRGGVVDESAIDKALEEGRLGFAALDVFENEPNPPVKLLMNPHISLSPHVGGSTDEAQERIGIELADQIVAQFGKQN